MSTPITVPGRLFCGADEELSPDEGSPRVIVDIYDGLLKQPGTPPTVSGLCARTVSTPPTTRIVCPGPEHTTHHYREPLPANASPLALSPGYVEDSDPEEDPEEDPKEDHADYPADGGDDDDEPSDDDDDDDTGDDDEEPFEDEEDHEEEEHLALADSSAIPITDNCSISQRTKH
ncbi:hypothetical protein Tco_1235955 [Tanacetum coccineum]